MQYPTNYIKTLNERYHKFSRDISTSNRKLGIELEFQIVPISNNKPNLLQMKNILNKMFEKFGFTKIEFDFDGNCIKGEKDNNIISFESSYTMLEISSAPADNLNVIASTVYFYINKIQAFLKQYNLVLIELGVHPFDWRKNIPYINNEYWNTCKSFFNDFHLNKEYSFKNVGALISATQLHLDLSLDELADYFNIINSLGWVKALLFANSPDIINDSTCLCCRDLLWEHSSHGYNPKNTGIVEHNFISHEDVFLSTLENSIFYVKRNNKMIYFKPRTLIEYLNSNSIKGAKIKDRKKIEVTITPELSDIQYSRPYNSIVITPKGTAEIKSECIQPIDDIMSHAAFHLGIVNNMEKIKELLLSIENTCSNKDLRRKAIFQGYEIEKEMNFDVESFIFKLLMLIKESLQTRHYQEEKYLQCLFKRLINKTNPAIEWLKKRNIHKQAV